MLVAVLMLMSSFAALAAVDYSKPGAPYEGDTQWDSTWRGTKDGTLSVGGLNPGDVVKFYRVLAYDQDAHTKVADLTDDSDVKQGAGSWKVIDTFATGTNAITGTELKAILSTGITDALGGKIAKNATGDADYTSDAALPPLIRFAVEAATEKPQILPGR